MPSTFGVVGMGYVGLTLTAALARAGHTVHGADTQPAVVESLAAGRTPVFEPGVEDIFAELVGTRIFVGAQLPECRYDAVVICVSTPVDQATHRPDLSNVATAARDIADRVAPGTLVVVRSTVPIGTTRAVVLPPLLAAWGRARLVMAPERTIQGRALVELVELPQIVGGLDGESLDAGLAAFRGLARTVIGVSSLETAEMVKLANNCHTDILYSYGNELALIAEGHGLDPLEIVNAANLGYPRPDLCKPGYVGGACLSKDPYLMIDGAATPPFLVGRARALNEYLPIHVANTVVTLLADECGTARGRRLAVLGWAYKGWPPTDDMRGAPISAMMPVFADADVTVLGHDPVVADEMIHRCGGQPVSLDKAFSDSDGVLIITDHPDYRAIRVASLLGERRPRFVYDSWRILSERTVTAAGMRYVGLGYRTGTPA